MVKKAVLFLICLAFTIFLFINPKAAADSVRSGLLFFAGVLVPSLFPITFITSFFIKFTPEKRIFRKNIKPFIIFIFSLIGGYTVGAKLIADSVGQGELSKKQAKMFSLICTNGGVGFIISAVGGGVLRSETAGLVLFLCHIIYPVAGFIILFPKMKNGGAPLMPADKKRISDIFCETASETAQVLLKIGGFVAVFSAVNAFLEQTKLGFLSFFFEIATAVNKTSNLPFLSFLLGFGGVSVIFQVLSIAGDMINTKTFLLSRLLHGFVAFALTALVSKVFKIAVPVGAVLNKVPLSAYHDSLSVSVCAVISVIILIISLEGKNRGGNLREDLLQ